MKAALVFGLVLAGASCAALGKGGFKDPVVTFKDVKIGGVGLTGGNLDIVLSVYNPNHYRLDAKRMTYQLFVDTLPLGTGAVDSRFQVQSNDSTEVRLPLHFNWTGVGAAGRDLLNSGSLPYRVTGDLTVGSGVGDFTIRYDRKGSFNSLTGASR